MGDLTQHNAKTKEFKQFSSIFEVVWRQVRVGKTGPERCLLAAPGQIKPRWPKNCSLRLSPGGPKTFLAAARRAPLEVQEDKNCSVKTASRRRWASLGPGGKNCSLQDDGAGLQLMPLANCSPKDCRPRRRREAQICRQPVPASVLPDCSVLTS